ncbi:argininosuccinate synthase [Xylaria acuta]|nr:argininosuccinate synthase [Xylaria acuta]
MEWVSALREKKISSLGQSKFHIDRIAYLLGTSLARPIIARAQVRAARKHNCQILSHGCGAQVLQGLGRPLLEFAAKHSIPVDQSPKKPWSQDENLVHTSFESCALEKPELEPPADLWTPTVDSREAPNEPLKFSIYFEKGIPVKLEVGSETTTGSLGLFKAVNRIGHDHGVGRVDILESRFIRLGLTLDSNVRRLRDQLVTTEWSRCMYNGMYFSPEREFLENSIAFSQKGFSPEDTSGFIAIQAIRLKKYGIQKITKNQAPAGR